MEAAKRLKIPMSQKQIPEVFVGSLKKNQLDQKEPLKVLCTNVIYDYTNPNGVILFGKTRMQNSWRSISVKILEIAKTIYFKTNYWEESEEKLKKLCSEKIIRNYEASRTTKKIFSNSKSLTVECVKVKFVSHSLTVPSVFPEHYFLTYKDENIENFLLKLDFNVPGWLEIREFLVSCPQTTNSHLEISCEEESLKKLESSGESDEIFTVLLVFDIWNDSILTEIHLKLYKNIEISKFQDLENSGFVEKFSVPGFKGEKELINFFLMKIQVYDPDLVFTPRSSDFLKKISNKFRTLSIKNWSRIGRIIRNKMPGDNFLKKIVAGRVFLEIDSFAPTIEEFSQHVAKSLILESCLYISKVTNIDFSRVLTSGVLPQVEMMLVRLFSKKGFIWPPKRKVAESKKVKFKGGLVIDPKPGLYENIVAMDFSSLYPSIIQEYEICITGKNLLSGLIENLISLRAELNRKILLNTEKNLEFLKKLQKILKSLANSLYGCFSCEFFRFYSPSISERIAEYGRKVLTQTSDSLIKHLQLGIIYGDTDSLMVVSDVTNLQQAEELGKFIETFINGYYKHVKIRLEAVYSKFFLLQKKNYAGVTANTKQIVVKGMIRGNNSEFCQRVIKDSLQILLENGFQGMDNLVMTTIRNVKHVEPGLLLIKNTSTSKLEIKKKGNDEIDWDWYVNREIIPFRNKVKEILLHDEDFFHLCKKKHKVFWFQEGQLVTDCKECKESLNISFSYPEEICQNITTLSLKQRIKDLYTQSSKKERKTIKTCKRLNGTCSKSTKNFNIFSHYCSFEAFNEFFNTFRNLSKEKIKIPSLETFYASSSYFLINLQKYSRRVDYSSLIFNHSADF